MNKILEVGVGKGGGGDIYIQGFRESGGGVRGGGVQGRRIIRIYD